MDLAHYSAILGVGGGQLVARVGQRHDVLLDESSGVAWRFPRTVEALEALEVSAARFQAAADSGLPAPSLVGVVVGPLGTARMGVVLLTGVGMAGEVTDELGPRSRATLVRDLVRLLGALRSVAPPSWPGAGVGWSARWDALAAELREHVVPLIGSSAGRRRAEAELVRAEAAAAEAGTTGLVHGDLGGENVLLDPVAGGLVGVLDWDGAGPGDPAVDLAAVLAHARPWLAEALMSVDPSLAGLRERADAYLATFALQQALWGVRSGDHAEVQGALAAYRAMG